MSFFKKTRGKRPSFSPPIQAVHEKTPIIEVQKVSKPVANQSDFEIPSAILAAAVVAKSQLEGRELQDWALRLQRNYAQGMYEAREREDKAIRE